MILHVSIITWPVESDPKSKINVRSLGLLEISCVPGLAVLSSATIARPTATFTLGQGRQGRQVGARSRQVGAAPLLLLLRAAALGAPPTHPVWPHQHAVTGVTVEVVLATN